MSKVFYARNPYPLPDISQEGHWIPHGPILAKCVSATDINWHAKISVHERLFSHHTLNSIRKDCRFFAKPQVPKDALDFVMDTVYKHNKCTMLPKEYVVIQPETVGKETWRVLHNKIKITLEPPKPDRPMHVSGYGDEEPIPTARAILSMDECHRGPTLPRRIHPSSVKLNIRGLHMDRSNPGYSRKIDGTFYSI